MSFAQMTKEGENRQGHMVDSLIHAREWLAGATVMRILDHVSLSISISMWGMVEGGGKSEHNHFLIVLD